MAMTENQRLLMFLTDEERALRARLADLEAQGFPQGVTTGDGREPEARRAIEDVKARLAQVQARMAGLGPGS